MTSRGSSKMINLVNYRLRVTMSDSRQFAGQMMAFDKHMNMVLADCEEFRRVKRKPAKGKSANAQEGGDVEVKRTLGLTVIRGEFVVSLSVEGPPPTDPSQRLGTMKPGPGMGRPAGRGMPVGQAQAPAGLAGPVRGVGGPMGAPGGFGGPPGGFAPQGFPAPPAGFRPPGQ